MIRLINYIFNQRFLKTCCNEGESFFFVHANLASLHGLLKATRRCQNARPLSTRARGNIGVKPPIICRQITIINNHKGTVAFAEGPGCAASSHLATRGNNPPGSDCESALAFTSSFVDSRVSASRLSLRFFAISKSSELRLRAVSVVCDSYTAGWRDTGVTATTTCWRDIPNDL